MENVDQKTIDCWRTNYALNKTPQQLYDYWIPFGPPVGAMLALKAAVDEIERLREVLEKFPAQI